LTSIPDGTADCQGVEGLELTFSIFSRRAAPEQETSMATLPPAAALALDRLSRSWYDPDWEWLVAPDYYFRTQDKNIQLPTCGERAVGAALLFRAEVRSLSEDRERG